MATALPLSYVRERRAEAFAMLADTTLPLDCRRMAWQCLKSLYRAPKYDDRKDDYVGGVLRELGLIEDDPTPCA